MHLLVDKCSCPFVYTLPKIWNKPMIFLIYYNADSGLSIANKVSLWHIPPWRNTAWWKCCVFVALWYWIWITEKRYGNYSRDINRKHGDNLMSISERQRHPQCYFLFAVVSLALRAINDQKHYRLTEWHLVWIFYKAIIRKLFSIPYNMWYCHAIMGSRWQICI